MGEQRTQANRINAQRSSGPRTELGKSRSKMNALKHGLSAKKIVIGDEDPTEFEALRAALERDWEPEMAFESELVDQLTGLFWRMRRVPAIEAAIVKSREEEAYERFCRQLGPLQFRPGMIEQAKERYQEKRQSELLLLIRDDDGMIEKLSRYHFSLMSAANRVIQQLRLIKIMRSSRTLIAFE
jgi:hypothetical protein